MSLSRISDIVRTHALKCSYPNGTHFVMSRELFELLSLRWPGNHVDGYALDYGLPQEDFFPNIPVVLDAFIEDPTLWFLVDGKDNELERGNVYEPIT